MHTTSFDLAARRGRWAVAGLFLVNGFVVGSWAPQIPGLLKRLAIGEFTLGLLLLGFGAGALVAMPMAGLLIGRTGSRNVVRPLALACCFGLLLVVLAPNLLVAAPAMLIFGALVGGMDVAMNANAVEVERRLGRAVMSSSHGFWSIGGFAGGGLGGFGIELLGHAGHAAAVAGVTLAAASFANRHLVHDAAPADHHAASKTGLPRDPLIYLIGFIALFSMIPEGAVLDWSALYLGQERGADISTAGLAFAAFSAVMAAMRFLGDGVRNRFGAVATLRVSSLVAAVGLAGGGLASDPLVAIAAFGFAGLGTANMVPIAFSAAGNRPGMARGAGLSVVTAMGYSGILVAPSILGFIAEKTGFAAVFLGVAVLPALVFLMSGLARDADARS